MLSDSDKQAKARQIIEEKKKLLAERVQKQNEERKKQEKQKELEKQKKQLEKFRNAKGWQPAKQKEIEKENVKVEEIVKIENLPPFALYMKPLIPPLSVNEEPPKSYTPDSQINYEEDFEDETPIESPDESKEEISLKLGSETVDDLEESSLCNFKCSETDFPMQETAKIIETQPKASFQITFEPTSTSTNNSSLAAVDPAQSLSKKQKDWKIEISETQKLNEIDTENQKLEKISKIEEIPQNVEYNDFFTIDDPVTIADHTAYFPDAPMLMNFDTFGENFYSKKNKNRYDADVIPENKETYECTPNEIDMLINDLENENATIEEEDNVLIGDLTQNEIERAENKPKKGELIVIDYGMDFKNKEKFEKLKKKQELKNDGERKKWNQAVPVPLSQEKTANSPKPQKRIIEKYTSEPKNDSKDCSPRENIKNNQNELVACIQRATKKVSSFIEEKNDIGGCSPRVNLQNPQNQLKPCAQRPAKKGTSSSISPKPQKKQDSLHSKNESLTSPPPPEQPKSRALTEEAKQAIASKYRRHKNLPNLIYNKPSNRKLIKKAIVQVCCAGEPNRAIREEAIEVIDKNEEISYFVIVFKSELGRRDLRAIYSHDPNSGDVKKIHGPATMPEQLNSSMIKAFFRFDSGANEFKPIECKDFITGTDAVVLKVNPKIY